MDPAAPVAETSELVDALVELSFAVQSVLARAAAEHQLSVTQLRLLGIVRDRTPAMSELAGHLGIDRSSATGLVDRAERRGLVERVTSTSDARVTTVRPTPAGREVGRRAAASVMSELTAVTDRLSKGEQDALVHAASFGPHLPVGDNSGQVAASSHGAGDDEGTAGGMSPPASSAGRTRKTG